MIYRWRDHVFVAIICVNGAQSNFFRIFCLSRARKKRVIKYSLWFYILPNNNNELIMMFEQWQRSIKQKKSHERILELLNFNSSWTSLALSSHLTLFSSIGKQNRNKDDRKTKLKHSSFFSLSNFWKYHQNNEKLIFEFNYCWIFYYSRMFFWELRKHHHRLF